MLIEVPVTVSDVMTREFTVVDEADDVSGLMAKSCEGSFCPWAVMDGPWFVGLITERELLLRASNSRSSPHHAWRERPCRAGDIMLRDVVTVTPETSLQDAGAVLLEAGSACLAVLAEGRVLVGLLTLADYVRLFVRAAAIRSGSGRPQPIHHLFGVHQP